MATAARPARARRAASALIVLMLALTGCAAEVAAHLGNEQYEASRVKP